MVEPVSSPLVKDTIPVDTPVVSCSGGKGDSLGHPLVYLNMGEKGHVTCPYCSREFVLVDPELGDYKDRAC